MTDLFKKLESLFMSGSTFERCPQCSLSGKLRKCPSCGLDACDKCIAVDNTDCISCGPHGDIFKELKGIMK